ncbi:MAG: DNA-3-methyladenine glycosylase I [Desulfovibrio sp.]|nr:DNA-3-methyladenine glycosylase I [Desulfovibrio sp.]
MERQRCLWYKNSSANMVRYHDEEWGVPCHDDTTQFQFLVLESAQAGLSWRTILDRREGYRRCFANFDPQKVAAFSEADVARLMQDSSIIRNRNKIESAVNNARVFLEIVAKHGSFCNWFWNFTDGWSIQNTWREMRDVPATSALSDTIAREMKALGFRFLGSTVLYAHMQATGMVNDHITSCFRHEELRHWPRYTPTT